MSENKTVIIDEIPSLAGGWVRVGFTSQAVYIETITKINELVKDYASTMQPTKSDLQVAMSNAETAKTIDVFDNADDVISSMRNKAKENALLKLSDYEKDLLGLNPFPKYTEELPDYQAQEVKVGKFYTLIKRPKPSELRSKFTDAKSAILNGVRFEVLEVNTIDVRVSVSSNYIENSSVSDVCYIKKKDFFKYYEECLPF